MSAIANPSFYAIFFGCYNFWKHKMISYGFERKSNFFLIEGSSTIFAGFTADLLTNPLYVNEKINWIDFC